MKRGLVVLILAVLLLSNVSVFADDLEDFKAEQIRLSQQLEQHRQIVEQIRMRLIQLAGLINYLEAQKVEEESEITPESQ